MTKNVLIIGAGRGLSASVARLFAAQGMKVGLAARNVEKLAVLSDQIGAKTYKCDATDPEAVSELFNAYDTDFGPLDVLVYNPNVMLRGTIAEVDPEGTKNTLSCFRLWSVPCGTAGGDPHAASRFRHDVVYRRLGRDKGLSKVRALRDGEVCLAWPVSKPCKRAVSAKHPRRSFCHRRSDFGSRR